MKKNKKRKWNIRKVVGATTLLFNLVLTILLLVLNVLLAGGLLIAVICVLRLLLQHRLHRSVLLALWTLAILRLLVPVFVSSELSVFNLPVFSRETVAVTAEAAEAVGTAAVATGTDAAVPAIPTGTEAAAAKASLSTGDILGLIWLGGLLLCGGAFLVSICAVSALSVSPCRCRRTFRSPTGFGCGCWMA